MTNCSQCGAPKKETNHWFFGQQYTRRTCTILATVLLAVTGLAYTFKPFALVPKLACVPVLANLRLVRLTERIGVASKAYKEEEHTGIFGITELKNISHLKRNWLGSDLVLVSRSDIFTPFWNSGDLGYPFGIFIPYFLEFANQESLDGVLLKRPTAFWDVVGEKVQIGEFVNSWSLANIADKQFNLDFFLLVGFSLYAYCYWSAKGGSNREWLILGFVVGMFVVLYSIFKIVDSLCEARKFVVQ